MTFQTDIEKIINNDNLTISEKLAKLSDLVEKYRQKIEQVKKEITIDYYYCPQCNDYYKISAWENGMRLITRRRCKNLPMGYLKKYKYEEVTEQEFYAECPKGHKIVDNYNC